MPQSGWRTSSFGSAYDGYPPICACETVPLKILRFSEASNWAPLSGNLRGTMMLERRCAVPGKNLPDTEKWLCSDCFVWRGLASMAQPVRPAAQALQQVEALTG